MKEIKCLDCGEIVARGEIGTKVRKSQKGYPHTKKTYMLKELPKGMIMRNKSDDPEKWTGLCSQCHKKRIREKKVEK